MKIDIKGTNLELTPAITEFIHEKIGSLSKFVGGFGVQGDDELSRHQSVEAFVEISRTTNHHRQGDVFKAEVNIKIGGRLIRAEKENVDVRTAIDLVQEELKAELKKEKGMQTAKFRKGARTVKRLLSISPLAWFKKEE
ncbi:MAG: ribosome-associated translation inhibitor RaiA [Candidatus Azambacteria bacterium]|nr:ribosome-associated translation inhibitor RaiA [Candidatus Azambacteria bacterium]